MKMYPKDHRTDAGDLKISPQAVSLHLKHTLAKTFLDSWSVVGRPLLQHLIRPLALFRESFGRGKPQKSCGFSCCLQFSLHCIILSICCFLLLLLLWLLGHTCKSFTPHLILYIKNYYYCYCLYNLI